VTGKIWALKYEEKSRRVAANRQIPGPAMFPNPPVMAIGADEQGELYLCDSFGNLWTAIAK
jgi:hypothetical protein